MANFNSNVDDIDRRRILRALREIRKYGSSLQCRTARFIEESDIEISVGRAKKLGGSGSVRIEKILWANWTILRREISITEAAGFLRLSVARETIDKGGQRGIEGTLVHEGKHALDFARMISGFSSGDKRKYFNPTLFQLEYSAHLTSAFYLKRRGGEFWREGIELGFLNENDGKFSVNRKGIRARLKKNYGLTKENPGKHINELPFPPIMPRKKWF